MKNKFVQILVFALIFSSFFPTIASSQGKNITPILSLLLTGPELPPGTIILPETGTILARYDRTESTDWIEIIGMEESGEPSLPITKVQANVEGNSFTVIWNNEKLVKFIYPVWTIDITYDADDKTHWTFVETATASSKATYSLEKVSAVDCTKSRLFYEIAVTDADILFATFHVQWLRWALFSSTGDGGDALGELIRMTESLGIVYDLVNGDAHMPFVENKIEAIEMLASYDDVCSLAPCAAQGLPGPETVSWKGRNWQRCDNGNVYSWVDAQAYCQNHTIDGYSDWYLPTKDELKDLVVCTNGTTTPLVDPPGHPYYCGDGSDIPFDKPTIDSQFLGRSVRYWSSTPSVIEMAWGVHFETGYALQYFRTAAHFVRCVREEASEN